MGFDVPGVEVMIWKPLLGLTALTRSPAQLNVLEVARELKRKNMDMIVNIDAISGCMQMNQSFED